MSELTSIRASSLAELFDCPARWESKYIKGLRLPTGGAAHLGTSIHAGTAVFDLARMDKHPVSIEEAQDAAVNTLYHPEREVDWQGEGPETREAACRALVALYCEQIAPAHEYVAVEATCEHLDIEDLGIRLTGTTDRIFRTQDGRFGIADLKTGKTIVDAAGAVKTAGKAAQIGCYELLASRLIGEPMQADAEIIGLQVAKTAKGQRAAIGTIHGAASLLLGSEEAPGLLQFAARILKEGFFYGNPNSTVCSDKYCPNFPSCPWR